MKRAILFASALLLSLSSVLMWATPKAFAATRTWDGGAGDNNMTTAANWAADTAPVAGDDLIFPANVTDRTITNDFTAGTSFNSITFSGTASADSDYTITGNSIAVVAGITHSMTGSFSIGATLGVPITLGGSQTFNAGSSTLTLNGTLNLSSHTLTFNTGSSLSAVTGVISGTGAITKTGSGYLQLTGDNTYSGATTVSAGQLVVGHVNGLGTAAGGTTVTSGASLYVYKSSGDLTYTEPLTLAGTGLDSFNAALEIGTSFGMGGVINPPYATSAFSGAITLTADTKVGVGYRNAKVTGAISGSHAISLRDSSIGTFQIASSSNGSTTANSTLEPPVKDTAYDADSASTTITVNYNETAIVKGTYGAVTVNPKGTLKGTGTVGAVMMFGTLAPGLSPGCLNTGNLEMLDGSAYTFEVGGTTACTGYDQTRVTGTVSLAGTLNVSLFNNFKPTAGQKYAIITNDGSDAVTGTFTGLVQGATITSGGYSFSISYTGGDGNDVELTSLGAAPNTGFALIQNNPMISLALLLGAAGAVAIIARRTAKTATRRR